MKGNCLKKNRKKYSLSEWLLFGVLFSFCSPWIIWESLIFSTILQYLFTVSLVVLYFKQGRFKSDGGQLIFLLLLLHFVVFQIFHTIHLSYIFIAVSFLVATKIKEEEGNNVIQMTTNYLYISIAVSLPFWFFHQFINPLPVFDYIDVSSWKFSNNALIYENHLFFITVEGREAVRFYSWFDEPGVLGTFSAFVLWANKFELKKYKVLVIFLGALFTFSMAFYVLTIIGWLINYRKSIKGVFFSLFFLCVVGYGLYYYLRDNLAFEQEIINRVLNIEDSGVDARMGIYVEQLWDKYKYTDDIFWGLGSGTLDKYGGISKSYQCFLLELGYLGLIIVLIAYFKLIKKWRLDGLFTLLIFLLSFMQRPQLYTTFDFILFSCIILNFEFERKSLFFSNNLIKTKLDNNEENSFS